MRNYIQVEDKFFKVLLNDKGAPVVIECTPQEAIDVQFENITLLDETVVDTSLFQEIIDKTQSEMAAQLERSLKNLVLSALGFSRTSTDGFVISGFNDEKSAVAKHLAAKLTDRVLNFDLDKEFDLTPGEKGKLKIAMTTKFKATYTDHMNNLVWKAARDLAEKHTKEAMETIAGDKMKNVAKALLEQAVFKDNSKTAFQRKVEARKQVSESETK